MSTFMATLYTKAGAFVDAIPGPTGPGVRQEMTQRHGIATGKARYATHKLVIEENTGTEWRVAGYSFCTVNRGATPQPQPEGTRPKGESLRVIEHDENLTGDYVYYADNTMAARRNASIGAGADRYEYSAWERVAEHQYTEPLLRGPNGALWGRIGARRMPEGIDNANRGMKRLIAKNAFINRQNTEAYNRIISTWPEAGTGRKEAGRITQIAETLYDNLVRVYGMRGPDLRAYINPDAAEFEEFLRRYNKYRENGIDFDSAQDFAELAEASGVIMAV